MMQRYMIYKKTALTMSGDDGKAKEYLAIPADHIRNGIFVPSSHPEVERSECGVIEAASPLQAVTFYRDRLSNSFM